MDIFLDFLFLSLFLSPLSRGDRKSLVLQQPDKLQLSKNKNREKYFQSRKNSNVAKFDKNSKIIQIVFDSTQVFTHF